MVQRCSYDIYFKVGLKFLESQVRQNNWSAFNSDQLLYSNKQRDTIPIDAPLTRNEYTSACSFAYSTFFFIFFFNYVVKKAGPSSALNKHWHNILLPLTCSANSLDCSIVVCIKV